MRKRLWMALRAAVDRDAAERDMNDELQFHLDQETAKNVALGMSPEDARRKAIVDFGGVERTKETYRDGRGTRTGEELFGDIRYAFRALRRDRALAIAGVVTLALGIGATTAVFSAVNAVILRPLPFGDAGRLVQIWEENPDRNWYK